MSIELHTGIMLIYMVSVVLLQMLSKEQKEALRKRLGLDTIKYMHNVALSAVSGMMGAAMLYSIIQDGRLNSWEAMACQNTPNTGLYGFANWVYLWSKIWEWVDTYWLVLYDKPVIGLHWFHHCTTFTMAGVSHPKSCVS